VRGFLFVMLLAGAGLLAVILRETDLTEVASRLQQIGLAGALAIVAVHAAGYVGLAISWLYAIRGAELRASRVYSLWKILMVGTALDTVTPLGGLGGEPAKALLLKRQLGVSYTDAAASLVITRMTDLAAQVIFIGVGLGLVLRADYLEPRERLAAGLGLAVFSAAITGFFAVQRWRGFSRFRAWLESGAFGSRELAARLSVGFDALVRVEDQLVHYYSAERRRFLLSVIGAFADWCSGAMAVFIAMWLLGHPVSAADALVIEAFVILVRSTFFFVPGDLGTQEAAHVLICTAVTGSPALGLALAAVRRARDLLWVAWGLAIGWRYSLLSGDERLAAESSAP
jgi:uncharacterized protein (TIRG00374 family)